MTDIADPPLRVCLVLTAYNHAAWVREACDAALQQDYSPLDIIFSDDASTDDSFKIMTEVAARYTGPHRIRLNRNAENLGLIRHVNALHAMADADLLVAAAGDDISLPQRVSAIVAAFHRSNGTAYAFHSSVTTIDAAGSPTGLRRPPLTDDHPDPAEWMTSMATLIGATEALTRPLFDVFGPITEQDAYEDLVLAFRAMLLGGLHFIDTPLVQYRENVGMSSQFRRQSHHDGLRARLTLEPAVLRQRQRDCLMVGRHALAARLTREAAGRQLLLRIELAEISAHDALRAAARSGLWKHWLKGYRRRLKRWAKMRWRTSENR